MRPNDSPRLITAASWVFLAFGVLVALAAALAVFPKGIGAVIVLLLAAVAAMLIPAKFIVWLLVVLTWVVIGPVQSLGRVDKTHWLPYLVALLLMFKALALSAGFRSLAIRPMTVDAPSRQNRHLSIVVAFVLGLSAVAAFGTAVALPDPIQLVLATRDYLWLWGVLAVIIVSRMDFEQVRKLFVFLPWVVVVQVPLVLYQRFALSKGELATRDAVVGLFSGNPDGGGASGAMGIFSALMAAYVLVRARAGLCSWWFAVLVGLAALVSIGLAEVKFVAIISPIIFVAVLGLGSVLRNPRVLLGIAVLVLASPLVLYGYWKSFEGVGAKTHASFERYVTLIIERNFDDGDIQRFSGEISRAAAVTFWWDQIRFQTDPVTASVGHGIGATRIGAFPGYLARKYTFKIARSSMVVLLWEVGLFGFALTVALLVLGWRRAEVLGQQFSGSNAEALCLMRLAAGVMVSTLLYLPYNTDFVGTPQAQLLFVLSCSAIWLADRSVVPVAGGFHRRSLCR